MSKAFPPIGETILIKGFAVTNSGSDEDPALVNSCQELMSAETLAAHLLSAVQTKQKISAADELAQKIADRSSKAGVGPICTVNATMFPEGAQSRNVRNIPCFASKEDALAYRGADNPRSTNPDEYLVAYPRE